MIPDDINISRHAILQFIRRWDGEQLRDAIGKMRAMMQQATEEHLGHGTAVRIIKNGFSPARYFRYKDWRFVTDEECTILITSERIYLKATRKNLKMRDKKRYGK